MPEQRQRHESRERAKSPRCSYLAALLRVVEGIAARAKEPAATAAAKSALAAVAVVPAAVGEPLRLLYRRTKASVRAPHITFLFARIFCSRRVLRACRALHRPPNAPRASPPLLPRRLTAPWRCHPALASRPRRGSGVEALVRSSRTHALGAPQSSHPTHAVRTLRGAHGQRATLVHAAGSREAPCVPAFPCRLPTCRRTWPSGCSPRPAPAPAPCARRLSRHPPRWVPGARCAPRERGSGAPQRRAAGAAEQTRAPRGAARGGAATAARGRWRASCVRTSADENSRASRARRCARTALW